MVLWFIHLYFTSNIFFVKNNFCELNFSVYPLFWKVLKQGYSGAYTPLQVKGHVMISTSPRFLSSMSYSQLFCQTLFTVLLLLLTLWFGEFLRIWALSPPPPPPQPMVSSQLAILKPRGTLKNQTPSRVTALPSHDLPKKRGTLGTDGTPKRNSMPLDKNAAVPWWPLSFHSRLFCWLKLGLLGKVQSVNSANEWGPSSGFEFSLYLHRWAWSASSLRFLFFFYSFINVK